MLLTQLIGVIRLDKATFREIAADPGALPQALWVVVAVGLLGALGSGPVYDSGAAFPLLGFLSAWVRTVVVWVLWAGVLLSVGTTLFKGQATFSELLRLIGFAYAPQALAVGFIAVHEGLKLDNLKTLISVLVGFILVSMGL